MEIIPVELKLKKTFAVSGGSALVKKNFMVRWGKRGWGEASGSVRYGPTEADVYNDLLDFEKTATVFKTIEELEECEFDGVNRVARTGLVNAGVNHLADSKGIRPWELLKLSRPDIITTSFTVGIDIPDTMIAEIATCPFPIVKVKMGFEGEEDLLDGLKSISGKIFRIDANGGWTPDRAEKMIYQLKNLPVEIIEQPTDLKYIGEWQYLKSQARSRTPVFIDEGLDTEMDYEKYCDRVDGINIKMAKSGGLIEAVKIARRAKRDKRKIMLGCMIESSIGIAPSVYMASLADYFDLDSPLLLENDPGEGLIYENEKLSISDKVMLPELKEQ